VGTGFTDGSLVFFGDSAAKMVTHKPEDVLTVETPNGLVGKVPVEIYTPTGQKFAMTDGFTFDPDGQSKPDSSSSAPTETRNLHISSASNIPKQAQPLFPWALDLNSDVRLLLIVVVVGALGSLIHVARSFYWYVGNRNLKTSWLLMYFLLPFTGAGLALLFFLIARGLSSTRLSIESSVDGYAALAALVGMFSQQALMKLKQIAEGFFSVAEKGKDPALPILSPNLVSITPSEGSTSGGTAVCITGTGLKGISHVTFGGVAATGILVKSDTSVTANAPPHSPGAVDVEVTSTTGQISSLKGAFNYADLNLESVEPTSGSAGGGTAIQIHGRGFGEGCGVEVGGVPATSIMVLSSKLISAIAPARALGVADVKITNSNGKSALLPGGFSYT